MTAVGAHGVPSGPFSGDPSAGGNDVVVPAAP
jgi:hypothetical protein